MKESHSEGVANRTGSESCGGPREGPAEALTGESTGRDIEPRKKVCFGTPTFCKHAEGNIRITDSARCSGVPRGRRPWQVWTRFAREPGDPAFAREQPGPHREVLRTGADEE